MRTNLEVSACLQSHRQLMSSVQPKSCSFFCAVLILKELYFNNLKRENNFTYYIVFILLWDLFSCIFHTLRIHSSIDDSTKNLKVIWLLHRNSYPHLLIILFLKQLSCSAQGHKPRGPCWHAVANQDNAELFLGGFIDFEIITIKTSNNKQPWEHPEGFGSGFFNSKASSPEECLS